MSYVLKEELPISFSPEMAKAVARFAKSQTRRVITPQNSLFDGSPGLRDEWAETNLDEAWVDPGPSPAGNRGPYLKAPRTWNEGADKTVHRIYPRYQPGVKLWVREEWWTHTRYDALSPSALPSDAPVWYRREKYEESSTWWGRARRSIHLPRRFCGMVLKVQECRPERIQDISHQDVRAEGVHCTLGYGPIERDAFRELWDKINESRGYGWDKNPWVWVISFILLATIGRSGR